MTPLKHDPAKSSVQVSGTIATLELFVAGDNMHSRLAQDNVNHVLTKLGLLMTLKVIDVLKCPRVALERQVFVTPALIVTTGNRTQMIIGNFNDSSLAEAILNGSLR